MTYVKRASSEVIQDKYAQLFIQKRREKLEEAANKISVSSEEN